MKRCGKISKTDEQTDVKRCGKISKTDEKIRRFRCGKNKNADVKNRCGLYESSVVQYVRKDDPEERCYLSIPN